jgi:glutamyl-tRNA reductase
VRLAAAELARVIHTRPARRRLVVHRAVPRYVPPAASSIDGVTLLDMDDLRAFASTGVAQRRREVAAVETILDAELERYLAATSAREVAPIIVAIRERAEQLRGGELERFQSRLANLDVGEAEAVEALTRGIVAKLLHEPTITLKDAAGSARGDRLVAALRELFRLDET